MNVAFRVDASIEIGTGHFMRCLTLATGLKQRGAQVRLVSRHMPEYLRDMVRAKGLDFSPLKGNSSRETAEEGAYAHWLGVSQAQDASDTLQALSDQLWDWVVVDHYALDTRWETALREAVRRVLVIDDIADRQHNCDILLDQNFYEDMDARYVNKVPANCLALLGPRYALLREEFRHFRTKVTPRMGLVKRVLVFFGGVDAGNYTARTIEALANIGNRDLHVDVVIGAQHPYRGQIESACMDHGYMCHVQTDRMAELMASADLAVGAGGSANWERCSVGLPALVFILADNQRQLVEESALQGLLYTPRSQSGTTTSIEYHLKALLDNPCLLRLISRMGMETVDCFGTQRVLQAMGCGSIKIREATQEDSESLYVWRNHSSIRAISRNTNSIERPVHEAWMNAVLDDPDRALLIGECRGEPVGVVRFDVNADEAEVSIYLVPNQQGKGLGAELLLAAEQWLAVSRSNVRSIKAETLGSNQLSHRLFRVCGYQTRSALYAKKVHRV